MRASDTVPEREREAGHLFFVPIAVLCGQVRLRSALPRSVGGPYDARLGYEQLDALVNRLSARGLASMPQDERILTLLEIDAFHQIRQAWRALGYPCVSLVPSYTTVIGVSGDTPEALASLAGMLVNQGVRYHRWSASSNCILRRPRLLRPS